MVHENIDCTVHISRIYDEKKNHFYDRKTRISFKSKTSHNFYSLSY